MFFLASQKPRMPGEPMPERRALLQQIFSGLVVTLVAVALVLFLVTPTREAILGWFRGPAEDGQARKTWKTPAELVREANGDYADGKGDYGLKISDDALKSLEVNPVPVKRAVELRPMPPQIGTVNFDIDYLYTIRPRFGGEIISFQQVEENPYPEGPPRKRDISFGDKVKSGSLLAIYWSKDLGLAKAALVDAIVNKKLSEDIVKRYTKLFNDGALSEATLRAAEKQLQNDLNAYRIALYPLYVWKLPKKEIEEVEHEADNVLKDLKKPRDPEEEIKRWARVEIRAPLLKDENGNPDPNRELVILEKNQTSGDFIDPGRDTPLFRLGDLTRLQIWVHPPEEYLPLLKASLPPQGPGTLKWKVRFQADGAGTEPLDLAISKIAPSLDPTLKTPMVIGELNNADRKYLVGQFVTATILVPPPPNTVEVPTDAINLVESQSLVFARKADGPPNEYFLRRVAVAQSTGKVTLVRSVLTDADRALSKAEVAKGRRPIRPLEPGEVVLTRGVVELTAFLEDLKEPGNKKE
jgi:cobalt-zinc-cadmium efflux system membrane fusion protein